jgi:hypothetical protein
MREFNRTPLSAMSTHQKDIDSVVDMVVTHSTVTFNIK